MTGRLRYKDDENDDQGLFTNRTTMMANFEEWIKMATDNKINSKNSWNFALIDYFHDLNVLRDSENNINFQKASATLDGCVKIYSSRVDSVTTETGKLLSGLAQKKNSDSQSTGGSSGNGENGDDSESQEAADDVQIDPTTGLPISNNTEDNSKRRIHNRILETTLVDFDTIKLKELDQELNIDPLFKKALVDFDEGGTKSLLLNTLNVDSSGRVVFDTAIKDEDIESESTKRLQQKIGPEEDEGENDNTDSTNHSGEVETTQDTSQLASGDFENSSILIEDEILSLGIEYIKFTEISHCEISSSIQQLRNVVDDVSKAKNFIDRVNNNFLSEQELQEAVPDTGSDLNTDNGALQDEYSYISQKDEDGEQQDGPKDREIEDGLDATVADEASDLEGNPGTLDDIYELDLMAYFDETLKRNWRGREHWKVRNLKKTGLLDENRGDTGPSAKSKSNKDGSEGDLSAKGRKKQSEIDFFALDDQLEETIFSSKKRTAIDLPIKSRKDDSHYLLPNDYQFSTQKITRLFIKPGQTMSLFNKGRRPESRHMSFEKNVVESRAETNDSLVIADEQFWAENYERIEKEEGNDDNDLNQEEIKEGMLSNPFNDDEDDVGVDFNQAFEEEEYKDYTLNTNSTEEPGKLHLGENRVNYSRVSKKVDVRKLKSNLWKSVNILVQRKRSEQSDSEGRKGLPMQLRFSEIAGEISGMYSNEMRKDISTSFCFICLLHLANEHGLQITNNENYDDLLITYDCERSDDNPDSNV